MATRSPASLAHPPDVGSGSAWASKEDHLADLHRRLSDALDRGDLFSAYVDPAPGRRTAGSPRRDPRGHRGAAGVPVPLPGDPVPLPGDRSAREGNGATAGGGVVSLLGRRPRSGGSRVGVPVRHADDLPGAVRRWWSGHRLDPLHILRALAPDHSLRSGLDRQNPLAAGLAGRIATKVIRQFSAASGTASAAATGRSRTSFRLDWDSRSRPERSTV